MVHQIHFTVKNYRYGIFVIFLLLFFSLTIAAQETTNAGEVTLHRFSLCKDIIEKNPVMEQNFFTSLDEKAVAWFQFSYRSPKDFAISWEWINPKGELHHRGVINMNAGNYQKYRTWYWVSIKKRFSALNFPGEWKVRIFINNKLLTEKNFFVIYLE